MQSHAASAAALGLAACAILMSAASSGQAQLPDAAAADAGAERAAADAGAEPPSTPMPPADVAGWVLVGLGAASFAAAVVTGAWALNLMGTLDQQCPERQCPPPWHSAVDQFDALRTASTVTLAASGALLLSGVAIVLLAPDEPDPRAASAPLHLGAAAVLRLGRRGAERAPGRAAGAWAAIRVGADGLQVGGAF